MFCRNCGSQIDDSAVVCPHCGTQVGNVAPNQTYGAPQQQPTYAAQPATANKSNPIAIVGFVLSFLVPLAGLICSIIGRNKAKNEGLDNGNLAKAGIIISIVAMVLNFIFGIIIGIAYGAMLDEILGGSYYALLSVL